MRNIFSSMTVVCDCLAIRSDGVLAIPHPTAPTSSSSAYSQLPLSVVETAGNNESLMPSQDAPVDFSVSSRSVTVQSADITLNNSIDTQPEGSIAFL